MTASDARSTVARGLARLFSLRRRGLRPSVGAIVHLYGLHERVWSASSEASEEEGIAVIEVNPAKPLTPIDVASLAGLRVAVIDWTDDDAAVDRVCRTIVEGGAAAVMGFRRGEGSIDAMREVYTFNPWLWRANDNGSTHP